MAQVGFIGLGIMGKPMARNLINAGYSLVVHDHKAAPMEELAAEGAGMAESCRQASEGCEVIITMLPDSANSEDAILGQNGVLEGAPAGATIIDMSSISPIVSQKIGAEAAKHGVEMLDAPVSGGEPGAIAGTLAIMVGGNEEIFQKHEELLHVMGRSVVRVGEVGAGNVVKVANQMIVAANIEVIGEALTLAQKAGIDPQGGLRCHTWRLGGQQCLGGQGSHDDGAQLPTRLSDTVTPEGPEQRHGDGQGLGRTGAGDQSLAADAGSFGQRRQGGLGPLGHRELH